MVRLSLQYPNGRVHNVDVELELPMNPGNSFEMYGRRWRVVGPSPPTRHGRTVDRTPVVGRVLCRAITGSPLDS